MSSQELPERPVVDASVAIKWYLPEIHAEAADRLLRSGRQLIAPDLIFPEVGNIAWKQVRAAQMTEADAVAVVRSLSHLSLLIYPSQPLITSAVQIGCRTDRTAYDSLYLALAVQEQTVLVTADTRLYNALQNTPYAPYVLWIEAVP